MTRRLAALFLLVMAFATAQTQWEYAEYKLTVTQSDLLPLPETFYALSYPRELLGADTWEDFRKLVGFPETEPPRSLSVLNLLGRQGYELTGYGTATWHNAIDDEITDRTWYFKRPLTSP